MSGIEDVVESLKQERVEFESRAKLQVADHARKQVEGLSRYTTRVKAQMSSTADGAAIAFSPPAPVVSLRQEYAPQQPRRAVELPVRYIEPVGYRPDPVATVEDAIEGVNERMRALLYGEEQVVVDE